MCFSDPRQMYSLILTLTPFERAADWLFAMALYNASNFKGPHR